MKENSEIERIIKELIFDTGCQSCNQDYKQMAHRLKARVAIEQYVIKARIEELERIQQTMGSIAGQIFEHFKTKRIAQLKEGLE